MSFRRALSLSVPLLIAGLAYLIEIPALDSMPYGEMAHRAICIVIIAALYWVLEPIPSYATSLFVAFMSLFFFDEALLPQKEVFAAFANPVIFLFLGGLFLARAVSICKLDLNLARVILRVCGNGTSVVLLSLMFLTAAMSMFMSNTATTAMMLSVALSISATLPRGDNYAKALVMGIPLAANVGGMGTPIGTAPNAVALSNLEAKNYDVSFLEWMFLALPIVCILLLFVWVFLRVLYKTELSQVEVKSLDGEFDTSPKAISVYVVFALTVVLWLSSKWHGIPSSVVAFLPVFLFSASGVIGKKELRNISWDVLWLISGGLVLGLVMERSSLSSWLVEQIPFSQMPFLLLLALLCLLGVCISTFISNTATANLLVPIAMGLSSLLPDDSKLFLPIALSLSCSLAMALPISTPPNALAFSTGVVTSSDFFKAGTIVSLVGLSVLFAFCFIWRSFALL